ncbi:MAG TPA: hypothetical protein VJZ27_17490 [Aggregatilineales bacterium]|nr:hypothetical protein [Aggregatilineales bacterium]
MENYYHLEIYAKQRNEEFQKEAEVYRRVKNSRSQKTKLPLFRKRSGKQTTWQPIIIPPSTFK